MKVNLTLTDLYNVKTHIQIDKEISNLDLFVYIYSVVCTISIEIGGVLTLKDQFEYECIENLIVESGVFFGIIGKCDYFVDISIHDDEIRIYKSITRRKKGLIYYVKGPKIFTSNLNGVKCVEDIDIPKVSLLNFDSVENNWEDLLK